MINTRPTHDAVVLLYWQRDRKVWRVVARSGNRAVTHTVDAHTTHELDQVALQRLAHAIKAEMESWLF